MNMNLSIFNYFSTARRYDSAVFAGPACVYVFVTIDCCCSCIVVILLCPR